LPAQRNGVLLLLLGSMLLFAAALWQQWRGSAGPAAAKPSAAVSPPATAATRPEPARLPVPAPALALALAPAPAPRAKPAPPAASTAAPQPAPGSAPPPHPSPPPQATAASDVEQLMQAPLAHLLLAALCKDPDGARRIFAQAVLHTDAAPAAAALSATEIPHAGPPEDRHEPTS
jgi:hypothetical protein